MKKREDFFNRYLDRIYDCREMFEEQGKSYAESGYNEIVAELLLSICDCLRTIRLLLCFGLGIVIGQTVSRIL